MARRPKTAKDLTQQERMLADAVNRNREYLDTAYAQINPNSTAKDFHKLALTWWNSPSIKEYTGRNVEPRKWTRRTFQSAEEEQTDETYDITPDEDPILFIYSFGQVAEHKRIEWSPDSPFKSQLLHDQCFNRYQVVVRKSDLLPTDPPEPPTDEDLSLVLDLEKDRAKYNYTLIDWGDDELSILYKKWRGKVASSVLERRGCNTPEEVIEALLE